jgi:hypothetical protein
LLRNDSRIDATNGWPLVHHWREFHRLQRHPEVDKIKTAAKYDGIMVARISQNEKEKKLAVLVAQKLTFWSVTMQVCGLKCLIHLGVMGFESVKCTIS